MLYVHGINIWMREQGIEHEANWKINRSDISQLHAIALSIGIDLYTYTKFHGSTNLEPCSGVYIHLLIGQAGPFLSTAIQNTINL